MSGRLIGVLGLARSGRAAAKLALARGDRVYASDAADSPELRAVADEIRAAGATVQLGGHGIDQLAACALLVLSPGIPPDAAVLREPRQEERMKKRQTTRPRTFSTSSDSVPSGCTH